MNRAYKFRIYPDSVQQVLFAKTFGCVRFIYNKMLGDKIAYYEETGRTLKNTPAGYKLEYGWLKEVDSLALANAQLNLEKAYKNFFRDKKAGFPKFKSKKHNHDSYTTNCVNGNIALEGGFLKLPKLGNIRIKQHRKVPDGFVLKSVTVSRTPTGKYFASILYEYEEDAPQIEPEEILGLDFSMKELFIPSEGGAARYPGYYRRMLEKLAKEQRKLSKCSRGSNNRNKQRLKVAGLHEKAANQRRDFLHKASRQITNAYDAVCIEDLNMKGMAQALRFGKSVHDNGWGMFTAFLDYKLAERGKKLVKIGRWFPSSRTCSCCGAVKSELPLAERTYICGCGIILDRDVNAAINIKREGMRILGIT